MKTLSSISLLQLQTQLASLWSGESAANCHSLNVLLSYWLRFVFCIFIICRDVSQVRTIIQPTSRDGRNINSFLLESSPDGSFCLEHFSHRLELEMLVHRVFLALKMHIRHLSVFVLVELQWARSPSFCWKVTLGNVKEHSEGSIGDLQSQSSIIWSFNKNM